MSDVSAHTEIRLGSEKNFGLVFSAVFLILAGIGLFYGSRLWLLPVAIAIPFFALAYLAPSLLRVPNRLWFRFGMVLHAVISPVVMFLMFVIAFVPIGLVFRIRGKDLLQREFDVDAPSYWTERTEGPGSMRRQF